MVKALDKRPAELPPLKLDHLRRMTDDTGMFQHAIFTLPNYHEGYTIDDNARALTVSTLLEELGSRRDCRSYVALFCFRLVRLQRQDRTLPQFYELPASAGWRKAVRTTVTAAPCGRWARCWDVRTHPRLQSMAGWVFEKALPAVLDTTSPRAWAFALIGIQRIPAAFRRRSHEQLRSAKYWPGGCSSCTGNIAPTEWRWYEEFAELLQCRAAPRLAHVRSNRSPIATMTDSRTGIAHLACRSAARRRSQAVILCRSVPTVFISAAARAPASISNRWKPRPWYQPAFEAHRITGDKSWYKEARCAFDWFLGRNDLNLADLRSDHGRLPGWFASRPPERKSRRRVFPRFLTSRAGTASWLKIHIRIRGGRSLNEQPSRRTLSAVTSTIRS